MLAATLKMQRLLRGWIGRRRFKKRKEQKVKDDLKKKYLLERKREEEREKWLREAEEIAYRENMLNRKKQEEENEQARLRMEKAKVTVVAILIVKSALKQTILGETAPIIHGQLGRNLQLAKIGLRLMMKRVEGFYTST